MKKCCLALLFVFELLLLHAFNVPYSTEPLCTDANLLPPMLRVNPEDAALEKLPTKVWLWQDEENLCIVYEAVIDSSFTPGPVCTRDTSSRADYVRLQLITIPEAYYAYLFNFYASGNLYDAVRETGRADLTFNTNYHYTSTVEGNLWRIEGKIPLGELRFRQKLPYHWKVIVTRHHDEGSEDFNMPAIKPDLMNDYFARAFDIELAHPVKRHLDIDVRPYLVKSYDLIAKTDSFDPDNIGLDVALHPAQRTRIKLSINPDFSDVPPDEAADIYNSRYPRYYTENRFFFTEDISAFGNMLEAFYSRRILSPELAFKATGSSTNLNWGVLAARDEEIVNSGMVLNRDDYFQVLSITPRNKVYSLPISLISRMNEDYYNHLLNSKLSWYLTKDIEVGSWNCVSVKDDDRNSESSTLWGSAHSLSLSLTPGQWSMDAYGTYVSRDIYADAGYLNDRFFHKFGADLGYDTKETRDYIINQGASCSFEYYNRYASHNYEMVVNSNYYIYLRPDYNLRASYAWGRELDLGDAAHYTWDSSAGGTYSHWEALSVQLDYTLAHELVLSLADAKPSQILQGSVWGTLKQVVGYSTSFAYRKYGYPHGVLADYGGLMSGATPLDNEYLIWNGGISYTPHQKLRLACGSGFSSYQESGLFGNMNLYGNLRYEFRSNNFFYAGFNNHRWQDGKFTYDNPLGHFSVDTSTAYAKISLSL